MKLKLPKGATAHRVEMFGQTIIFCTTPEQYNKVKKRLKSEPSDSFGAGKAEWMQNGSHNLYMIGVFDGRNGTLAHEAAHIAFFILHVVGVPVVPGEPNEAFCYLLGEIYEAFAPHLLETEAP